MNEGQAEEKAAANPGRPWYLYILRCRGNSLYTGITTDVAKRFAAHAAGKGARYTRSFPPEQLVLVVAYADKGSALAAELAVKAMRPAAKRQWITANGGQLAPPSAAPLAGEP